ncbi:uncharacterized protein EDB91DRAFT_491525 [Suillus paluster]|uniref:uncharacterized protein n=1 Tax=Suillus paluster TaxID=48578 RepID=UPI001B86064E|nr:uncharacterized protein EDB91DRAFT_491525 [Suillus paluster]KAG1737148.1 hypothetical protein EDB91DRAFT_491525 [Suillus paluster]
MVLTIQWPERFADLKREIVEATPDYERRLTESWNDLLQELNQRTTEITDEGPNYIPQVHFQYLDILVPEQLDDIRRKGSIVIHGVVEESEAACWKTALEDFIKANPHVEGFPERDKQFFFLYWTRAQVQARAHPNVLKASIWLNNLYRTKTDKKMEGVDLDVPLVYADRIRIRHPGVQWDVHPPHVDGGSMERWEDDNFRRCFADILSGNWRQHDPYELEGRLDARASLYGRAGQATVFRTFQGWLAISKTAPTQGTLKVFPDVFLSNAYTILRPFFRPTVPLDSKDILDPENWVFDISTPDFPGIQPRDNGWVGPQPTPKLHPHLRLDDTMTSVPKVNPGDMVFWHCDVVHSVEQEHTGSCDSAVMYIPAVPQTPQNTAYVKKQAETFLAGTNPPDFAKDGTGFPYIGLGVDADVVQPISRIAMGLPVAVA